MIKRKTLKRAIFWALALVLIALLLAGVLFVLWWIAQPGMLV